MRGNNAATMVHEVGATELATGRVDQWAKGHGDTLHMSKDGSARDGMQIAGGGWCAQTSCARPWVYRCKAKGHRGAAVCEGGMHRDGGAMQCVGGPTMIL